MSGRPPKLTAEQAFKKRFVERKLLPMLEAATDGAVAGMVYKASRDDEEVRVAFKHDPLPPVTIRVNVSLDSKWAIACDVMRAIRDHL